MRRVLDLDLDSDQRILRLWVRHPGRRGYFHALSSVGARCGFSDPGQTETMVRNAIANATVDAGSWTGSAYS
jgi:hypothetical protein